MIIKNKNIIDLIIHKSIKIIKTDINLFCKDYPNCQNCIYIKLKLKLSCRSRLYYKLKYVFMILRYLHKLKEYVIKKVNNIKC